MKKKIIEKLELPYDDGKGNFSSGSGEIHILRKVNEIIDVLNSWVFEPTLTIPSQSQKQPEEQEDWREEWRKLSFEIGSITKQQADEIEDFISKLLSEREEEAYRSGELERWSKLLKGELERLSKLLKEKGE